MTQNPKMPEPQSIPAPVRRESPLLGRLVLVLAGLFVFWPALHGGWLWDDQYLFVYNRDMRTLGGLERIWFGHTQTDYWPLYSTALWLEVHFFGNHPLPYHVASLALHLCGAFLLWKLFARLGLEERWAWLGALLFVIHPLVVESVAWVSELKNTLSLPLFLLALLAWLDFDEGRRPADYARALVFYLLAMLAKTSVITLPAVLLLYAWWKHGRVALADLKRTAPFFLIALVLGVVTQRSQSNYKEADEVIQHLTVLTHLVCAGTTTFFYLGQFFFPQRLLPIYPRWNLEPPSAWQWATLPLLALVLGALWTQRKGWGRHALLGLGFFLLHLLPVSGLVTMSYMSFSWVADHLAYIPIIGLIGLVVAGLQGASAAMPASARSYLLAGIFALCLFLAWRSHQYARVFKDELTLWTYNAEQTPDAAEVQNALANTLLHTGQLNEALEHAELAVQLQPDKTKYETGLADVLALIPGRLPDAIEAYQKSLAMEPDYPLARVSLGNALDKAGQTAEAIAQFQQALQEDPNDARAHIDLADTLVKDPARRDEAVSEYRAALQLLPDDAATHMDLANLLAAMPGRLSEALPEYRTAEGLAPNMPEIHNDFGSALMKAPDHLPDAAREFQIALRLRPNFVGAQYNLAVALAQMPGHEAEAIPLLEAVTQARPDFTPAQDLLAKLRGQ